MNVADYVTRTEYSTEELKSQNKARWRQGARRRYPKQRQDAASLILSQADVSGLTQQEVVRLKVKMDVATMLDEPEQGEVADG